MSLPRVTVAVLFAVLAVGGCKTVTGRVWFPVYADTAEAVGEVTVHFTVDCGTAGRDDPVVRLRYVDTVAAVSFEAEGTAPLCAGLDALYSIYGPYRGFYYPDDDPDARSRRAGTFALEIVDGGDPGYSAEDYLCFSLQRGALESYRLPARDDVDDDGFQDEGCTYIGGGVVQINLDSTEPHF